MLRCRSVSQCNFSAPSSWTLPSNSSYIPPTIANSVLQRFNPTSAYPTPPPPGIRSSSSSLAFALGYPSQVRSQQRVYKPDESGPFFKDFLNRSAQLLDSKPVHPASTPKPVQPASTTPQHSPSKVDSLPSKPPPLAVSQPSVTPRKRKSPDELITPSQKRIHAANPTSSPSLWRSTSETPSHKSSKSSRQVFAYVNVPAPTWKTPSTKPSKYSGDPVSGDESADEDGDYRRDIHASVKSSARRIGDRDERGMKSHIYIIHQLISCVSQRLWRSSTP